MRTVTAALAAVAILGAAAFVALRRLVVRPARHRSQTEADYRRAAHRVLVLGGGFGGITVARTLDRHLAGRDDGTADVSVLVVDRDSDLLYQPLLWTVADGRVNPNHVTVPLRALQRDAGFHLLHAEVEAIDLANREVRTSAGPRPYDTLVVALGSVTAVPDLPGLREHARRFATPGDAIELRNHVIDAVEAAHRTVDPAERQAWLTFVVGGGGDTGIELAATIHEYVNGGLLRAYPWLKRATPRIVVVGRADRLVPMSSPRTSDAVRVLLQHEGIEVLTGTSIQGVDEREVRTSAGPIPARTLFWAAGITATPPVRDLPVEHASNGSVVVDGTLRVPGHPEVFVIGDSAWAFSDDAGERTPVPPTAQAAEHQGRYVARLIADRLAGEDAPVEPFTFAPKGRLALLGQRTGVAEIGSRVVTGIPAWLLWHAYYWLRIPSWRNRLRLLVDVLLAAVSGRETTQLRLNPAAKSDE